MGICSVHPWEARSCRLMIRLLVGEHELQSCIYNRPDRRTGPPTQTCHLCDEYAEENVPHLLFRCSTFGKHRKRLWDSIIDEAPLCMTKEMDRMNPNELTVFWLSGFNCKYVHEWVNLYSSVCAYITTLYRLRITTLPDVK